MAISLIIPVLNEEENVPSLWSRLQSATEALNEDFEVVFIDDGSTDRTASLIEALPSAPRLVWKLVKFSRNFGHQAAISAGMSEASGEALIFLDADLQDPPELIPVFLQKFREGYDVVYGVRQNRKEAWWLRFCFAAFYRVLNRMAERPIPLDAGDFSLISRRVAREISRMPEQDRLIRGLRSWVGYRQIGVPYDRPERNAGVTKYRIWRRVEGALDGIFGFSRVPIRIALYLGLVVCAISGAYLIKSFVDALFFTNEAVPGWKSLTTLAFMLGGANIVAIGIVGEYVCRIYFQVKSRPLYVVDAIRTSPYSASIEPDRQREGSNPSVQ